LGNLVILVSPTCGHLIIFFYLLLLLFFLPKGAHINPSVTLAMALTRIISPLRAAMYITAQCGGGIAGAALLYG